MLFAFQQRFVEVQHKGFPKVLEDKEPAYQHCFFFSYVCDSITVGISSRAMKGKVLEHFRNLKLFLL